MKTGMAPSVGSRDRDRDREGTGVRNRDNGPIHQRAPWFIYHVEGKYNDGIVGFYQTCKNNTGKTRSC